MFEFDQYSAELTNLQKSLYDLRDSLCHGGDVK